jgi:hypothetical protein
MLLVRERRWTQTVVATNHHNGASNLLWKRTRVRASTIWRAPLKKATNNGQKWPKKFKKGFRNLKWPEKMMERGKCLRNSGFFYGF